MAKINARLPSVVTLNRHTFLSMAASHSQTLACHVACSVPSFVVSDGPHTTYLVVTLLGFSTLALHDELSFELPRLPHIFPAAKMLLSGLPQVKRRRVGELDSYLRLAASLAGTAFRISGRG